ncbi:MAG TPA: LemA family protein [Bacteroidales bacterium]|nr:LemA family protein [Bacteroidales bacterium]HNS46932.1 LemA family protein [Bacteroidales bacterium]
MSNKYTKWVVIAVILLLVLLFIGWATGIYNNLVTLEEKVSAQWAQVENVYQRRADLIPNLVNTVKGYAEHEQETFTKVIEARAKASSMTIDPENLTPEALQQFEQAQAQLSSALSRLLVTVERYPDLKANQNFLELQAQLEGTENRITVERQKFNDTAREYNTSIRRFPRNIVAGLFGFDRKPYFEAKPGADEAPKVEF